MKARIFGQHEEATLRQIETCLEAGGARGVLCADGHKGYAQPIGGVIAYREQISLSGVGFDIACGNLAIRTDALGADIAPQIGSIMDDIAREIAFGVGRKSKQRIDHELFDDEAWKMEPLRSLKETARAQLGAVGGGNHYVDIFADELDRVWVGVHFGSRGLGYKTATYFLRAAGGGDGMDVPPTVVSTTGELGADYLTAMNLAGQYAYAGPEAVARHVVRALLGADPVEEVHNHHNFAWREQHGNEEFWVVRKGATPAFPGQRGFVGGSMGDNAAVLEGIESADAREALYSTVHGAARVMSRTMAKRQMATGRRTKDSGRGPHSTRRNDALDKRAWN